MDSIALTLPNNSYFNYNSSLFHGETVCRLLPVASCKTLSIHPKSSSSKDYAASRHQSSSSRKSVLSRATNEDKISPNTFSDNKSSRRDQLIALFKRIQIEISQGESGSGYYNRSSQASSEDDSYIETSETSVLEFLQQSNRETIAASSKLKRDEEPYHKRATENEKSFSIPPPQSTNKFTRPPSTFVKKSPVPSSTPLQSSDFEVNNEDLSSSQPEKEALNIEGLKLSELKELAKARGMSGYSKLKKSDLVQLLKS